VRESCWGKLKLPVVKLGIVIWVLRWHSVLLLGLSLALVLKSPDAPALN